VDTRKLKAGGPWDGGSTSPHPIRSSLYLRL
jgi:hypothetical protein